MRTRAAKRLIPSTRARAGRLRRRRSERDIHQLLLLLGLGLRGLFDPRQRGGYFPKQRLDVEPRLCAVSTKSTFSSFAFRSPSSTLTSRLSTRSVLFPTSAITTSVPRSARTSSIHFEVLAKDDRLETPYTTTATLLSRMLPTG